MVRRKTARRWVLTTGAAAVALALTGCGEDATGTGTGGEGGSAASPLLIWAVESGNSDSYTAGVERWNADHPDQPIQLELMPNDGYKDKIRVALGGGQGPDLFYTWGGGGLQSYIDEGMVEPLGQFAETYPDLISKYIPSTLGPVTFDDDVWALPIANTQPVVTFYNTEVFEQAGVEVPGTWDELSTVSATLREHGVAPFTLAGQSKWPQLPYISYLVDRIGGPEVFEAITANEPDSWSDPAVVQAVEMIQDMVEAQDITPDFASLAYETGAADALLYSNKAGMQVMLASLYQNISKAAPEFVERGGLDAFAFPTVPAGAGDPSSLVGNPSVYLALNSAASDEHKDTAAQFFAEQVHGEQWTQEILDRGAIPPLVDAGDLLGDDNPVQKFVFDLVADAETFTLSWDQALSPVQGTALTTALDKVFLLQSTPQEFVDTMNATIGQ